LSFKYSYNTIVYTGENYSTQAKRVSKYGYDAIELVGEPDLYDLKEVNKINEDSGIVVSSICSIFTAERDLIHPDKSERLKAIDYCKKIADMLAEVQGNTMIVAPSPVGKMYPLASPENEEGWAIENIQKVGEYAATLNVNISIEPWNRYETYFINRLDQAIKILDQLNLSNAGIHGDTFHMSIDEKNIADAYLKTGNKLNHVHMADSNRAAPGQGHTDFLPILQILKDINFSGYLTMELIPAASDPFACIRDGGAEEFKDKYTEQSIKHLKNIESKLL
jgi:sugar phosphate isomerase/epimerase